MINLLKVALEPVFNINAFYGRCVPLLFFVRLFMSCRSVSASVRRERCISPLTPVHGHPVNLCLVESSGTGTPRGRDSGHGEARGRTKIEIQSYDRPPWNARARVRVFHSRMRCSHAAPFEKNEIRLGAAIGRNKKARNEKRDRT